MTIKEILGYAVKKFKENNIEESTLKAKILVAFYLNQPREYLITHDNKELDKDIELKINESINKIIEGKPLQYIIGKQEFMGLNFEVNENVLIPRPDTETLVEEAINIAQIFEEPKILDLCTGSGAIAVSLKKHIKNAKIIGTDVSKQALTVAELNAKTNNTDIKFIQSDLFENIDENFDIIVSNPPYIKTEVIKKLSKEVQNEPYIALNGGKDGLDFYKKIINSAYNYLNYNGYLCLEIGYDQKEDVIKLIEISGKYDKIYSKKDLSKNDRIVVCRRR